MRQIVFMLFMFLRLGDINCSGQLLSLDSVLSRIERNNPALHSYTNKIAGESARVNGAKAWRPALIGVQAGENPYSFDFKNNSYQMMFFAEQWFPNGKRNFANENYLKSFPSIRQFEYEYLRNQIYYHAKEAYYERYISEKKIIILKDNIELMKAMIDINERHLSSGMGDLGTIYKMKARLADSETMLLHEQNMVKTWTVSLNYFMNDDMISTFEIDTNKIIKRYPAGVLLSFLNDSMALQRSDVLKTTQEISSTKLNQQLMSMQGKPDFGFRFEHTSIFKGKDVYAAMFMMSVPIFPKSKRNYTSEIKALDFEIDAMEQDKQATINSINQMITVLALELSTEYAEVDNYQNRVLPAYKKSFDVNLLSYSQNNGELMKAVLAWDELLMAQMEFIKHLETLLKVQAEYEREAQIR